MKILTVGDIHGKSEYIEAAYLKFLNDHYDKLIFIGDYADSFVRTNEEIMNCFELLHQIKKTYFDDVVLLLGNHDIQYMYFPEYRCSGFRKEIQKTLTIFLRENKKDFQLCYQLNKNGKHYLFSHAGVNDKWFEIHEKEINEFAKRIGIDVEDKDKIGELFNKMNETSSRKILHTIGKIRGGVDYGGITWCDKSEMLYYTPLNGFHQIVGHTSQEEIETIDTFDANKEYDNTSVTFIDVLDDHKRKAQMGMDFVIPFYSLEI